MTDVDQQTAARVTSRDGTEIGYWVSGQGPPLVVVHGATADHTRWRPVLPLLEPHLTVVAVDRRGRGASSDAAEYGIEREFEDIAAVVDAVAGATGGTVHLLGHSYGANCALGAATLTAHVGKLMLYEPSVGEGDEVIPAELLGQLEALLAAGQREALLETFFREAVMMPDHELEAFRRLPAWQARVAGAHTLPRELRVVVDGDAYDPQRAATVTVPTLMLLGGDSPTVVKTETETVAAALPHGRVVVLDGQQHIAIDTAPQLFANAVLSFLRSP